MIYDRNMPGRALYMAAILLLIAGAFCVSSADDDTKREQGHPPQETDLDDRYRVNNRTGVDSRSGEHDPKQPFPPIDNQPYMDSCGLCHLLYQPGLLPAGSWERIIAGLDDHFGAKVGLNPESKRAIGNYLKLHAAEHSQVELSVEILKSLDRQTPIRLYQIPYLQQSHHEFHPDTYKQKAIGSFANCLACHKTAEEGIYDEKDVNLPW